jgi:hypothetical protein
VAELVLSVSEDEGQSYRLVGKMPTDRKHCRFHASRDGIYWFIVQVVDGQGSCLPANPSRVKPSLRLCVDTMAPKAQLLRPQVKQNTVDFGWLATDANLGGRPVTLEWAEQKGGPWCLIGEDHLPNTGTYTWHLPERMPPRIYLRIRVRDNAENEACATTDKPISIRDE